MLRRLRKLVPRYSLRTLVVFLLLVTSAWGLWWRWEPWYVVNEFQERHPYDGQPTMGVGDISPDGKLIALLERETMWWAYPSGGGYDRHLWDRATICDISTGEPVMHIPGAGDVHFLPDSRHVYAGDGYSVTRDWKSYRVWDIASRRCVSRGYGEDGEFAGGYISPDGKYLVSYVNAESAFWLWDMRAGRRLGLVDGLNGNVIGVAGFALDGQRCVVRGGTSIRNLAELGAAVPLRPDMCVCTAAFSPDGSVIACSSCFGDLGLYDAHSGKRLPLEFGVGKRATDFWFSLDGTRLVTEFDHGVQVWDARILTKLAERRTHAIPKGYLASGGTLLALLWGGRDDYRAEIWDARSLRTLTSFGPVDSTEHFGGRPPSRDGRTLALATAWGVVTVYRRRRRVWWWGVLWLWEFWLTVAFACLFIWSVVRDRRALARTG